jgi:hypothetical protein
MFELMKRASIIRPFTRTILEIAVGQGNNSVNLSLSKCGPFVWCPSGVNNRLLPVAILVVNVHQREVKIMDSNEAIFRDIRGPIKQRISKYMGF